jgi:hypothetical protein
VTIVVFLYQDSRSKPSEAPRPRQSRFWGWGGEVCGKFLGFCVFCVYCPFLRISVVLYTDRKIEGVLASRAAAERRMMRERAEYMTESEMEESESEQTAHNLSASLVNMAGDSDEDSSTDS